MGKLADSSTNLRSTGKRGEGGKKEIYVSLTIVSKAWRYIRGRKEKGRVRSVFALLFGQRIYNWVFRVISLRRGANFRRLKNSKTSSYFSMERLTRLEDLQ